MSGLGADLKEIGADLKMGQPGSTKSWFAHVVHVEGTSIRGVVR